MASSDVVMDVGETLVSIVRAGVSSIVNPSSVATTTMDLIVGGLSLPQPAVSILLYDISTNAELRNALPAPGFPRPRLPLDLRYLITPWATDAGTVHQVCGLVLQTLYDNATLVRGDLVGSSWGSDDTLQILLDDIPVSEHHNIWEPADIPYKLSLAYLVRVIGLDPGMPESAGIVASVSSVQTV